jgi:drug/metabolite transporter (DMT)-like permease
VQPFAYLQLVFASGVGFLVFGDVLRPNVAVGAAIVVGAGVFTLIRTRKVQAAGS